VKGKKEDDAKKNNNMKMMKPLLREFVVSNWWYNVSVKKVSEYL